MGVSLALFSGTHGRGLGSCQAFRLSKKARARHLRRCLFYSRMPEAVPCPNGPKCPLTCECVDILPACLTLVPKQP
jgi:hypothetical protein